MNHEELVQVYKDTVLEVLDGDKSAIFLDTDKMLAVPREERAAEAARQIKEESPELYEKLAEINAKTDFDVFERLSSIDISELSASAFLVKGLEGFAVITTPSVVKDTVNEIIPSVDAISQLPIAVENFPATDKEMIMFIAAHEAAHVKGREFEQQRQATQDLNGKILEEQRADNIATEYMKNKGNAEIGPAYLEIRAINNLLNGLPGDHSTVGYDANVSAAQNIEEAKAARSIMDNAVTQATGQSGFALLLTDPKEYAQAVRKNLIEGNPQNLAPSQLKKIEILTNAIEKYVKPDPELENTKVQDPTASVQSMDFSAKSGGMAVGDPGMIQMVADIGTAVDPALLPQQAPVMAPGLAAISIQPPSTNV